MRVNARTAPASIRNFETFTAGKLSASFVYPLTMRPPVYIVKSYELPIAVFDGDTWHILDSDFISSTTSRHLNLVKRSIGTADAYSEFPVVPTKAAMDALIDRLTRKD